MLTRTAWSKTVLFGVAGKALWDVDVCSDYRGGSGEGKREQKGDDHSFHLRSLSFRFHEWLERKVRVHGAGVPEANRCNVFRIQNSEILLWKDPARKRQFGNFGLQLITDAEMKKVESKAPLERGPISDLWRNTLSQIPSIFGRLLYLSNLRAANSGTYEHFGMAQRFGPRAAHDALRKSHEETFREWLNFSLEEQKADVDLYLEGLDMERTAVIDTWLRLQPYRNVVPVAARGPEELLFSTDFRALLEILRNEYGVAVPDRDA